MKKLEFDKKDVWTSEVEPTSALNLLSCNIGKEGYFSDSPEFNSYIHLKFTGVQIDKNGITYIGEGIYLSYFILADKVKEIEEPTYRAYKTLSEFPFRLGNELIYRYKDEPNVKYRRLITGIDTENCGIEMTLKSIILGNGDSVTPNFMLKLEYFDGSKWLPFGVKK